MLMNVNASESHGLSLPNLSYQPMKQWELQAGLIRLRRKEGGGVRGEAGGLWLSLQASLGPEGDKGGG